MHLHTLCAGKREKKEWVQRFTMLAFENIESERFIHTYIHEQHKLSLTPYGNMLTKTLFATWTVFIIFVHAFFFSFIISILLSVMHCKCIGEKAEIDTAQGNKMLQICVFVLYEFRTCWQWRQTLTILENCTEQYCAVALYASEDDNNNKKVINNTLGKSKADYILLLSIFCFCFSISIGQNTMDHAKWDNT